MTVWPPRASDTAADKTRARQLAQQAFDVLGELQKQWPSDYYIVYISRRDIAEMQKQLNVLLK